MRNKFVFISTLIACFGISLPLASDIEPRPVVAPTKAAVAADTETRSSDDSRLRCWQYGELLFEELKIAEKTLSQVPGTIAFERDGSRQARLHLVKMGTATCLYEE